MPLPLIMNDPRASKVEYDEKIIKLIMLTMYCMNTWAMVQKKLF